jgi:hypothetical protein
VGDGGEDFGALVAGVFKGCGGGGGVGVAWVSVGIFLFLCSVGFLVSLTTKGQGRRDGWGKDSRERRKYGGRKGGLRIPRTVRTTNMFAIGTNLHSSREQRRTLMTRPPNPLHGLLPHQRLPTSPTRHSQDIFLRNTPIRIRLNSSLNSLRSFMLLPLRALRLRLLNGIARTLRATWMLTCSTDFVPSECSLAFVACPMDAHPNRLLDAQSFFVGLGG